MATAGWVKKQGCCTKYKKEAAARAGSSRQQQWDLVRLLGKFYYQFIFRSLHKSARRVRFEQQGSVRGRGTKYKKEAAATEGRAGQQQSGPFQHSSKFFYQVIFAKRPEKHKSENRIPPGTKSR